eukprot:1138942-Pelagomonas_calceolata.AAC.4
MLTDDADDVPKWHERQRNFAGNAAPIGRHSIIKTLLDALQAVELPLTHPELYEDIGIKPPKLANEVLSGLIVCVQGVILYGEPGTGKTLLAKAVANSTSATFLRVVGSELIQNKSVNAPGRNKPVQKFQQRDCECASTNPIGVQYLGDGPKLVRELFRVADDTAPSIVFIGEALGSSPVPVMHLSQARLHDSLLQPLRCPPPQPLTCARFPTDEIDAIGTKRYESQSSGEREIQRTMLELLNQLDGFDAVGDVKVCCLVDAPSSLHACWQGPEFVPGLRASEPAAKNLVLIKTRAGILGMLHYECSASADPFPIHKRVCLQQRTWLCE